LQGREYFRGRLVGLFLSQRHNIKLPVILSPYTSQFGLGETFVLIEIKKSKKILPGRKLFIILPPG
jgi:hypothetical protein